MMSHEERLQASRKLDLFKKETASRLSRDRKQINIEVPTPIAKPLLEIDRLVRDMWRTEEARVVNWAKEHELQGSTLSPESGRRKPIRITIEQEHVLGGDREGTKKVFEL